MPKKLNHDEIKLLIAEGKTLAEIAWAVDCNQSTVRLLAKKWGLKVTHHSKSDDSKYAKDTIDYLDSIQHPKPKDVRQGEGLSQAPSNFIVANYLW